MRCLFDTKAGFICNHFLIFSKAVTLATPAFLAIEP